MGCVLYRTVSCLVVVETFDTIGFMLLLVRLDSSVLLCCLYSLFVAYFIRICWLFVLT